MKRLSNGRSPLVNPQRQITSFFSKTTSPSPSPTLSKLNPKKSNPDTNPSCDYRSPSPDPSPTTPSPLQSKPKKPRLLIGQTPSPPPSTPASTKSYGEEVVGKRIRVYWPLDKSWYEGSIKSFDKEGNKHLIHYEDDEEESLDLGKETIEWVQQSVSGFKRLRRGSCVASEKVIIKDDNEAMVDEKSDNESDSEDEDWGKNAYKEQISEDDEVDLVDEKEEEVSKEKKRKAGGGNKKSKSIGDAIKGGFKVSVMEPLKNVEGEKLSSGFDKALAADVSERFGAREVEKLRFLGSERRDANRRRPGDVNYNPRTLYLPPDFLRSLTDGQRQWWEFKSKHMDKVMFFKMGKFYELFEMDAHIGAKELDLQYMKGGQPHCGFPEKNFSMNVEKLARKVGT